MQALSTNYVDDSNTLGFCPICRVNYITDEETVCETCVVESELSKEELDALYGGIEVGKEETTDTEDEDLDDEEDLEIVSLGLEDEEEESLDEDEESVDPLSDFEELDDDDLEEDEEENI